MLSLPKAPTIAAAILLFSTALLSPACKKGEETGEEKGGKKPAATDAGAGTKTDAGAAGSEAQGTLILVQSQFIAGDGGPRPGPAVLGILRAASKGEEWQMEKIEDPDSNVYHGVLPYEGGLLAIGGTKARIVWWSEGKEGWKPTVLWERSWGGKFDRMRDIAFADLDGDDKDELVVATHDRGVVAVGKGSGTTWEFVEFGEKPDTFVHEVEVGDLDGDGKTEIYTTPSDRNKANKSQAGAVFRHIWSEGKLESTKVAGWENTHAKEILVADIDGDNKDELYILREAVKGEGGGTDVVEPVQVQRARPDGDTWKVDVIAEIDDKQARFLLATDLNGDGKKELTLTAMNTGVWQLTPDGDDWLQQNIDRQSGGFEQAAHAADLDGDGTEELYVASDKHRELRRYRWDGSNFERDTLATLAPRTITWGIHHLPTK